MTLNFKLDEHKCQIHKIGEWGKSVEITITIDWVSNGLYALNLPETEYEGHTIKSVDKTVLPEITTCPPPPKIETIPVIRKTKSCYITLKEEFFDQILEAFKKSKPSSYAFAPQNVFTPIWEGHIEPRGMMLGPKRLLAYNNQGWLIIHQQSAFLDKPSPHLTEIILNIDDFKKIRDKAFNTEEIRSRFKAVLGAKLC